ncbi:hypothetical protein L249_1492 [Ophiocordyceps polyrhachis-furcata BCC 54312]|uniref:Uncharacterized protein n=1 Tax=Ophiocordyceps polyrhachis-furcata BCC 54312 TaxID=1330021 RepID=A0A367L4E1_9HYPO|nr:hypothetical protein L249_1492 [Ophiocordyceps polyrhachis-furcata BCC 54312]
MEGETRREDEKLTRSAATDELFAGGTRYGFVTAQTQMRNGGPSFRAARRKVARRQHVVVAVALWQHPPYHISDRLATPPFPFPSLPTMPIDAVTETGKKGADDLSVPRAHYCILTHSRPRLKTSRAIFLPRN